MGQNYCVTYTYEYRMLLIISERIKQKIKCARTVAVRGIGVGYFLIISKIIEQKVLLRRADPLSRGVLPSLASLLSRDLNT